MWWASAGVCAAGGLCSRGFCRGEQEGCYVGRLASVWTWAPLCRPVHLPYCLHSSGICVECVCTSTWALSRGRGVHLLQGLALHVLILRKSALSGACTALSFLSRHPRPPRPARLGAGGGARRSLLGPLLIPQKCKFPHRNGVYGQEVFLCASYTRREVF